MTNRELAADHAAKAEDHLDRAAKPQKVEHAISLGTRANVHATLALYYSNLAGAEGDR